MTDPSLRRRWPLWIALLLLADGIALGAAASFYLWLYLHRAEHPEFYVLRPYFELGLPLLIAFSLGLTIGYYAFARTLAARPSWFAWRNQGDSREIDIRTSRSPQSLTTSQAIPPVDLRQPRRTIQ